MKNYSNFIYKFLKFIVICIICSIPFGFSITNIFIIVGLLFSFYILSTKKILYEFRKNAILKVFVFYFFINIFSLIYSKNTNYGLSVISRLTFFISIPIIIFAYKLIANELFINKLYKYYVLSCVCACIICLLNALYQTYDYASVNPFNKNNGNFFSYILLTAIIKKHPIYFGTNLILAIVLLLNGYLTSKILKYNLFTVFLIMFFGVFVFLLNSFLLLVILFIVLFYYSYELYKNNILTLSKIYSVPIAAIFLILLLSSGHFISEKAKGIHLQKDLMTRDFTGEDFTAVKARVAKAYCSVQVIKRNFFLGVGIGDCPDELIKEYKKEGFVHGFKRKFNSHNQYLTTFISSGILSFISLCFLIFLIFKNAINNKNTVLFFFILMHTLFFMTESVLERQQGLIFFVFFITLFTTFDKNNLSNETDEN